MWMARVCSICKLGSVLLHWHANCCHSCICVSSQWLGLYLLDEIQSPHIELLKLLQESNVFSDNVEQV